MWYAIGGCRIVAASLCEDPGNSRAVVMSNRPILGSNGLFSRLCLISHMRVVWGK
uniref:Uncharacterized protein n=1 Tax=Arundo donax TaxID=35708 RepID=A0A0A9GA40_ARUDO